MNIRIEKSIYSDLKKMGNQTVNAKVFRVVSDVKQAVTVKDIPQLRKLSGRKMSIFYRIRIGVYRIGITIEGGLVTFVRCMHRKDFYRHFPEI